MSPRRSYTLIELVIAMSVITVLMTMVMPSFLNSRKAAWDTQARSSVEQALRSAHALWVTERQFSSLAELEARMQRDHPTLTVLTDATQVDEPDEVFFHRADAQTVLLCSRSHSGNAFCAQAREAGSDAPGTITPASTNTVSFAPGEGAPADGASSTATFAWSAATPAPEGFECRLDEGAWSDCTSPHQVSGLAIGSHSLDVRVKGDVPGPPTRHQWQRLSYQQAVIASGPFHYYRMDEGIGVGSDHVSWDAVTHAEGSGVVWSNFNQTSGDARKGTAAYGLGRHMFGSSYAEIGGSSTMSFDASFSVEFWMRWNGGAPCMFGRGVAANRQGLHICMKADGGLRFGYYFEDLDAPAGSVTSGPTHVLVTYDHLADLSRIYINGAKKAEGPQGPLLPGGQSNFKIGALFNGAQPFSGVLDEYAIYDRALPEAEALGHWPTTPPPNF